MIQFTRITANNCSLTKTFKLDSHGQVESTAIAHMTEGSAALMECADVGQLQFVLDALQPNQAITTGIPTVGNTALTTRAGVDFRPDAVARTNEAFRYPYGPALFPFDVDVDSDRFQSVQDVLDALESCHPWLTHVLRVARPSSSSYVGGRGLRGVHVYIGITNGSDTPDLKSRVEIEQWEKGQGFIKISKSGALLTRQLSDSMVYQPSRLMFEALPVLDGVDRPIPPEQRFIVRAPNPLAGRPATARAADGLLDVKGLPALKALQKRAFDTHVRQAKDSRRLAAKKVAIAYQVENMIASGYDAKEGERIGLLAIRAFGDKKLPPSWTIAVAGVGMVKVADILANIDSALGFQCADPFDTWRPDLAPKHFTKAEIVMKDDVPGIWSHKLQDFIAFSAETKGDLASPLEQASEKLCGLIEYEERVGKKAAPLVNIAQAIKELAREAEVPLRFNVCLDKFENNELPTTVDWLTALSRVGCYSVSASAVNSALGLLAADNEYDPWRDTVLSLPKWDGTPRLDTFFCDYGGVLTCDALVLTTQLLFAGILMRQITPGITCPVTPVLIGGQGVGKSYFVHQLAQVLNAPPPATVTFSDPVRMSMAAAGSVVAELAEMSGYGKRDAEEVKAWLTNDMDKYRKTYAPEAIDHPRRFVTIGTANKHALNNDKSGNRRFMPVFINCRIDPNWTVEARQVFAEAKKRFCDDRDVYLKLCYQAATAVFEHNALDMREGVGTPDSDLDDLLPPIIARLVTGDRRVSSAAIRTALDLTPSGRQYNAGKVSDWLESRGWVRFRSSTSRGFIAPPSYDMTPSVSNVITGPFAGTA
jgi:hypothetical protein